MLPSSGLNSMRSYNQENQHRQLHRCENLKFRTEGPAPVATRSES
jgi:hypothetical protein